MRLENLNLLVMGGIAAAGGGCACAANALLKALLAHLIIQRRQWVIVDLEAGVEHLGRGTVQFVDGLIVVSEPSLRSLQTASRISAMARNMGLARQVLLINRASNDFRLPNVEGLPSLVVLIPHLSSLADRQLNSPSVLNLVERDELDHAVGQILAGLRTKN